ncbi:MAG: hypothetical protein KJ056_02505 [Acidimicrobiia bacterium]|nr:hypothetical protein [Acidimicrobiia bacterium]
MRPIWILAGRGAFRGAGTRLFGAWVVAVAVTVGLVGTAPSPASAAPAAAPAASSYRPGRDVARRVVLNGSGDGGWVLDARGPVRAFGSAPDLSGAPDWGDWRIARDLLVGAGGTGGYLLDGWGGIHRLGDAAPVPGGAPYWRGWDIARRLVMNPAGAGGWVLDGWGGIHPFGGAPELTGGPYWRGWDIARDLVVTAGGTAGYVLDGWGGIHPVGDAAPVGGSPYWAGRDLARRLVLSPAGAGGWVLDGWGGIHRFGGAPAITGGPYWRGWDIARDLAVGSGGDAFVLDGWGGVHTGAWTAAPVNVTAPAVTGINGEGTTLTATPGTWAGAAPIIYSYQWYECEDADVGSCYDDLGSDASQTVDGRWPVAVKVTATNPSGSASVWSAVAEPDGPRISGPWPDVSGDAVVGATLTVTPTTWSGMEPITISYHWEACDSVYGGGCVTIGTDSDQVTLSAAEVGRYVRVSVTGTNPAGSQSYGSAFVGPIAAGP